MGSNRQQGTNVHFAVEGAGTPEHPHIPVVRLLPATPVLDPSVYRQLGASYLFAAAGLGTPENPAAPLVRLAEDHPVGAIEVFPLHAVPGDRLECDGSAVARADYPALFAAIGTAFGAGDGATTFTLPSHPRRRYPSPAGPDVLTVEVPGLEGATVEVRVATLVTTIKA